MGNNDNLTVAVAGLSIFRHNWCMNVEETEKQNDLIFRCNECPFISNPGGKCLVKEFAYDHKEEHSYPMGKFSVMSR